MTSKEVQSWRNVYIRDFGKCMSANTVVKLCDEVDRLRGELEMAAMSLQADSPAYRRIQEALNLSELK